MIILINQIHDCFISIYNKEPLDTEILDIMKFIPERILLIGEQYGYYDTEFKEKIYTYIKNNKPVTKEFIEIQQLKEALSMLIDIVAEDRPNLKLDNYKKLL